MAMYCAPRARPAPPAHERYSRSCGGQPRCKKRIISCRRALSDRVYSTVWSTFRDETLRKCCPQGSLSRAAVRALGFSADRARRPNRCRFPRSFTFLLPSLHLSSLVARSSQAPRLSLPRRSFLAASASFAFPPSHSFPRRGTVHIKHAVLQVLPCVPRPRRARLRARQRLEGHFCRYVRLSIASARELAAIKETRRLEAPVATSRPLRRAGRVTRR